MDLIRNLLRHHSLWRSIQRSDEASLVVGEVSPRTDRINWSFPPLKKGAKESTNEENVTAIPVAARPAAIFASLLARRSARS